MASTPDSQRFSRGIPREPKSSTVRLSVPSAPQSAESRELAAVALKGGAPPCWLAQHVTSERTRGYRPTCLSGVLTRCEAKVTKAVMQSRSSAFRTGAAALGNFLLRRRLGRQIKDRR